ncbi:Abortive infection protein AbiGI [Lachnospiraceae bacterium TWA4]|nr:Abortive infection protein AbiGI [Lachnospiraceae bacterium TWA4]
MTRTEELENLIDKNHGYLITSQAVQKGFTKPFIYKYIREHQMEKAAHGIYNLEEVWQDELFILQTRNQKIIYSDETALYLHRLTDREYSKICFTVPGGYNVSHMKNVNKEVRYVQKDVYELGACMVESISGNQIKAYDMERCICDLVKYRNSYEVQTFQTAMKEYMRHSKKNLSRLVGYAKKLGMRDEVMKYVMV